MEDNQYYNYHGISPNHKSLGIAMKLWCLAGLVGGHRYYLQKYATAVIWSATLGIFGLGAIYDFFMLPLMVQRYNLAVNRIEKFYATNPNKDFSFEEQYQIDQLTYLPVLHTIAQHDYAPQKRDRLWSQGNSEQLSVRKKFARMHSASPSDFQHSIRAFSKLTKGITSEPLHHSESHPVFELNSSRSDQ